MNIKSIRNHPELVETAILYFQDKWASASSMMVYDDAIRHTSKKGLPQWYLLMDESDSILGCAGLITNDFISRMDLFPWLCALYVEKDVRNQGLGKALIHYVLEDAKLLGFDALYVCTDHCGYYEKSGFSYLDIGYHPWGETSRIYTYLFTK